MSDPAAQLTLVELDCTNPHAHTSPGKMLSIQEGDGGGFSINGCGGPYRTVGEVRYSNLSAHSRERVRRRLDELLFDHEITGAQVDDFYHRDGLS